MTHAEEMVPRVGKCQRILLTEDPFRDLRGGRFLYRGGGYWPAHWIRHPGLTLSIEL
jgi:hypothetical protein